MAMKMLQCCGTRIRTPIFFIKNDLNLFQNLRFYSTKIDSPFSKEMKERKNASKKLVGAHFSAMGGVSSAILEAMSIGCKAFSIPIPRRLFQEEADEFKSLLTNSGFSTAVVLPHSSYYINLGSPKPDLLQKSREGMIKEMNKCASMGLELFNFHAGSTLGIIGEQNCIKLIAESMNMIHTQVPKMVTVLEVTAGTGYTIGHKFEHIRDIIDLIKDKDRVGVTLDTCHLFSAGYDLRTSDGFSKVMKQFEDIIGIKYLRGVHLNDSKCEFNARKDRHEKIGKGFIGLECFKFIMNDSRFDNIPMVLETSSLFTDYPDEVALLYSLETNPGKIQYL